jgi:hypothetical protein
MTVRARSRLAGSGRKGRRLTTGRRH